MPAAERPELECSKLLALPASVTILHSAVTVSDESVSQLTRSRGNRRRDCHWPVSVGAVNDENRDTDFHDNDDSEIRRRQAGWASHDHDTRNVKDATASAVRLRVRV